jgi:hypothetical protein
MRLAMLVVIVLCAAGCSGIHQSGSVSPASFFLPGIMKADPPKTSSPVSLPEPAKEFASIK